MLFTLSLLKDMRALKQSSNVESLEKFKKYRYNLPEPNENNPINQQEWPIKQWAPEENQLISGDCIEKKEILKYFKGAQQSISPMAENYKNPFSLKLGSAKDSQPQEEDPQYQSQKKDPQYQSQEEGPRQSQKEDPRYQSQEEDPRYQSQKKDPQYQSQEEGPQYQSQKEDPYQFQEKEKEKNLTKTKQKKLYKKGSHAPYEDTQLLSQSCFSFFQNQHPLTRKCPQGQSQIKKIDASINNLMKNNNQEREKANDLTKQQIICIKEITSGIQSSMLIKEVNKQSILRLPDFLRTLLDNMDNIDNSVSSFFFLLCRNSINKSIMNINYILMLARANEVDNENLMLIPVIQNNKNLMLIPYIQNNQERNEEEGAWVLWIIWIIYLIFYFFYPDAFNDLYLYLYS
jgi:hypothetical protein